MKLHPTEQVAEYLAQGLTFEQIAQRMGQTVSGPKAAFARIRKQLGWQAV